MPGKLNVGLDALDPGTQSSKSKVAKSYCEGRSAEIAGVLQTANPHVGQGAKDESFIAWDSGWADALAATDPLGCAE